MNDIRIAMSAWVNEWQILDGYTTDKQPYDISNGSVAPGWVFLLDELAERLIELGWNRRLCQVKEKFGGLRFYIDYDDYSPEIQEQMYSHIINIENVSYTICQNCSRTGTLRKNSWWRTLCDKCYNNESSVI